MEHGKKRVSLELTLETRDADRFERFLFQTGRKKVPWVRQLILKALEEDEAIQSGRTQSDGKVPNYKVGDKILLEVSELTTWMTKHKRD